MSANTNWNRKSESLCHVPSSTRGISIHVSLFFIFFFCVYFAIYRFSALLIFYAFLCVARIFRSKLYFLSFNAFMTLKLYELFSALYFRRKFFAAWKTKKKKKWKSGGKCHFINLICTQKWMSTQANMKATHKKDVCLSSCRRLWFRICLLMQPNVIQILIFMCAICNFLFECKICLKLSQSRKVERKVCWFNNA